MFLSGNKGDDIRKARTEKIISVDDDESDHSDIGETSEPDVDDQDSAKYRLCEKPDSNSNVNSTGERRNSDGESIKTSGTQEAESPSVSESESQPRPKIWSISNFLGNSKGECSSQSSKSPDTPAIVCSRQTNKLAYLNFSQSGEGLRVPNGHAQFAFGLQGLPLSLNQTTLSYPYTLSSSAGHKSDSSLQHTAALRSSEQAFKEELMKKAARLQNGIFSPARQIDDIRVGKKMIL